ncbi:hypothetical protein [Pseudescherichia sp.]|uniref:hypothetical protein n=1 Tax=Pseudescherichia sp. TaxID=2055881 RepID=UPI0028B016AB|nr:hypothetical protein [Pseudescherichia sp.]
MNVNSLPLYRSHKLVRAAMITQVTPVMAKEGGALLSLQGLAGSVMVSEEYLANHKPYDGGYLVIYADGYRSFSPAAPFEEGYVLEHEPAELTLVPQPETSTDHYSQAQRRQHEVDLLTQLVGSLNNCSHGPTHGRLQDIVNKQIAVVEQLIK